MYTTHQSAILECNQDHPHWECVTEHSWVKQCQSHLGVWEEKCIPNRTKSIKLFPPFVERLSRYFFGCSVSNKDYSMLHACFSFSVSGSNGKGYPRSKPRWSCVQRCAEYSHPNYWHWAPEDLNLCCEGSDETSSDVFCKEMIVDTSRTKQHAKMSVKSVNVRRECKFCIWPGPCEIKMCCWSFGSGFLYRSLRCAKS